MCGTRSAQTMLNKALFFPFRSRFAHGTGGSGTRTVNFTARCGNGVFSVFSRGLTVGMCVSANENLPNGHIVVLARFLPFNFQSTTFP